MSKLSVSLSMNGGTLRPWHLGLGRTATACMATVALALGLAACGGGDSGDKEAIPQAAVELAQAAGAVATPADPETTAKVHRVVQASASDAGGALPSAISRLFDLGESAYAVHFAPSGQADRSAGALAYRYYPATRSYLLVHRSTLQVYVLGGDFGPRLTAVGHVHDFLAAPTLAVVASGSGSGTVRSSPAGIDCGAACSFGGFGWDRVVTLSASADRGALFVGWSGGCAGSAASCTLTLDDSRSVTAAFEIPLLRVDVSGSGTVSAPGVGIECGTRCESRVAAGSLVALSAAAAPGWVFAGWSGACSGTGATCLVLMNAAHRPLAALFKRAG